MTPEERRRRLARIGPLSSGTPNPRFRNFMFPGLGMPISDKAWYEIPPASGARSDDPSFGTIEGYRAGLDPETGGFIRPYMDKQVLDYLQSKRPTSTPTSVGGGYDPFGVVPPTSEGGGYDPFGVVPPTSVGGGYDPIGFVPTTSVGGGWDLFPEGQPSTVSQKSSIPTLDESYFVAGRDIQEEASDQILEQIRLNALSEEAWNIEKNKLIQADNKMELAVALLTGTQPNLTRLDVSSGASSASNVKAQSDLERSMLVNEWMKNPPKTKDQVIEFGTKMNASPSGWTYIKNTLAPLFDYGDMVTWKKLMPDGTVKYGYSRDNDTNRNQLFRNEQYRTGSLEDDRKAKVAIDQKRASDLFIKFLNKRAVTQELLDEFTTRTPEILGNPDMIVAVEGIAKLYDLKPSMAVFYVTEDYEDHNKVLRKKGDRFSINTNTKGYQTELANKSTSRLSEGKEFDISQSKARGQALKDTANDLGSLLENEEVQRNDDLLLDEANKLLLKRANEDPLFIIQEGDAEKVLAQMEESSVRTQITGTMFNVIDTSFEGGMSHKEIKKLVSQLFGSANISDAKMKEAQEYIDTLFTQPDLAPVIDTETIQSFPIQDEAGNISYVNATVKDKVIRIGDSKTGFIDVPKWIGEEDIFDIIPRVKLVEHANGNKELKIVPGRFFQTFKIPHMEKETENIKDTIATLIKKPTEYWDAYNSYNAIYDQINVGIPDPDAWASVDQRIVTLAIKLVDTSMVTESEFDSYADKAGIGDKIRHQLRKWRTGEPITAGQKRAIIKMTEQWLKTKQKAILGVATSLKKTLDKRYPVGGKSDVRLPRGYEIEDLFNSAGASFDLMNAIPRSADDFMESTPQHKLFFGIEDEDGADDYKDAPTTLDKLDAEHGVQLIPENRVRGRRRN